MFNFDGVDERQDKLNRIKELGLPIFIWGGGIYSEYIIKYLKFNGIENEVRHVVDDKYKRDGDGCLSLTDYVDHCALDSVLIVGFFDYGMVRGRYMEYREKIPYLFDFRINCVNGKLLTWDKNDAIKRLPEFERTYNMLSDEKSKRTMELFLKAAVNGKFDALWDECYVKRAYFNSLTKRKDIDTLIDCGAFDGQEILDFVKCFPNYKKIYAIEPDGENVGMLKSNMQKNSVAEVDIICKGVYKETTMLTFHSGEDEASHLSKEGDICVPVIAIDEMVNENCGSLFIKMDIEGSEMCALEGARETIVSRHPCLAVCVYHKEDDLVTIPSFIDSMAGDETYEYFLRFHGNSTSELVFYAIPK